MYALAGKRVFVAGHREMVGSAIVRRLESEDCLVLTPSAPELDLADQASVRGWMAAERPQAVFLAAGRVGGLLANDSCSADILYDNLVIQTNVIEAAHQLGVEKLLFLGSSCIYPKLASQPIQEEALLTGPLEPTHEWCAVARIAGIKLCEAYRRQHGREFISAVPTNLYGPGDNFDCDSGHVIPALIRRAHQAKTEGGPFVTWGSGAPRREFLHVDDCADACVHLMKVYSDALHVNVGWGEDVTIHELAETVARTVGFEGEIAWDRTKPDGTLRKLMHTGRLRQLGWAPGKSLDRGLAETYEWFLGNALHASA